MNKIEKLIHDLCPEGVPTVRLGDQASYVRGLTYSKSDELDGGPIRVLRSNNINFEGNVLNFESVKTLGSAAKAKNEQLLRSNDILISAASGSRAHVGKVAYIHQDMGFYFGGFMAVLRSGPDLESRYLFHVLTSSRFRDYLDQAVDSTTIKNLNAQIMGSFPLPLPPIQVQQKIVSILDKFTGLEAELEAEVERRTRQYKAYRGRLLDFSKANEAQPFSRFIHESCPEGLPLLELGDLAKVSTGQAPSEDWKTGTGEYPFINGGTSPSGFVRSSNTSGGAIVIPSRGSVGKVAYIEHPFWCGPLSYRIRSIDETRVVNKFVFYSLKNSEHEIVALQQSGSIPALNRKELVRFRLTLPPLHVQAQIVSILDKFTELDTRLGTELEARRKQYEYYRNKLLSFKELDAE